MNYDLIILGVSYCTSEQALQWAENIKEKNRSGHLLIVIVDTSAEKTDPNLETRLTEAGGEVLYINPRSNLGYFGGARYGLKMLEERGISFAGLVVANVDIRFETDDLIQSIASYDGENVGVLAPSILSEEGKDLNPYKLERMTKAQQQRRIMYLRFPAMQKIIDVMRRIRKEKVQQTPCRDGQKIYMGYGACIIFYSRYFERGGDLNLPLFLYGEEPYVAEKCLKSGLEMRYAPRIVVRDIGHVSTSKIPSKKHREYLIKSAQYCIEQFYH